MGYKLYANLFYGVDLGFGKAGISGLEDIEKIVAEENGLADTDWPKISEIMKTLPIEVACHGDGGEATALLVRGVKVIEAWGDASKKVAKEDLVVDEALVAPFKEWCASHGIDNPEPSWLLVGTNN